MKTHTFTSGTMLKAMTFTLKHKKILLILKKLSVNFEMVRDI